MQHSTARLATPTLSSLRLEIDRIDDALLHLVEERLSASAAIAALKDAESGNRLKLRPRREAEIVDRLTRRARTAPPAMIGHVWRTLMAYGLHDQSPMRVVIHGGGDRLALQDVARERFGPAASLAWASCAADALGAAEREEAVAVTFGDAPPDLAGTSLQVFDRLSVGDQPAWAIGRIASSDISDGAGA